MTLYPINCSHRTTSGANENFQLDLIKTNVLISHEPSEALLNSERLCSKTGLGKKFQRRRLMEYSQKQLVSKLLTKKNERS